MTTLSVYSKHNNIYPQPVGQAVPDNGLAGQVCPIDVPDKSTVIPEGKCRGT